MVKKFALIGREISQSLSPALFREGYKNRGGENYSYTLIDCNSFEEGFEVFNGEGYLAANITSPFKEKALPYCDKLDYWAKESGAVNLIKRVGREIEGYNTDCQGVLSPIKERGIAPTDAIVVGAGGAARAGVVALREAGFKVTLLNRTPSKAERLAREFGVAWERLETLPQLALKGGLLLYTVDAHLSILDQLDFRRLFLFEANYKKRYLNSYLSLGYISGIEWLIHQALPSYTIFTEVEPELKELYRLVKDY